MKSNIIKVKRRDKSLVGRLFFDRDTNSVRKVTGIGKDGSLEINGSISYWVRSFGLKEYFFANDITGMTPREAKKEIGDYVFKIRETTLKEQINRALKT